MLISQITTSSLAPQTFVSALAAEPTTTRATTIYHNTMRNFISLSYILLQQAVNII
jgi:hypothetical protein